MVIENLHLHFLPRSVQLKMPSMDIDAKKKKKEEVKEHNQELNPSPIDEVRKKRKRKDSHGMEAVSNGLNDSSTAFPTTDGDPNQSKKKKKRKKKDSLSLEKPNEHSTGGVQLEHLVARFLSSRGLSNTLSAFLSETQHEYSRNANMVDLEDIYNYYLDQICEQSRKQKDEVTQLKDQARDAVLKGFGKLDRDVKSNNEDIKAKDDKGKSRKKGDAKVELPSRKTLNCSVEAKTGALEQDRYRMDKRKQSAKVAVDDFDGLAQETPKCRKDSGMITGTNKGSTKLPKPLNESEKVSELAELVCKSQTMSKEEKKKKKTKSDEWTLSDNKEQTGGKESKKQKKVPKENLQSRSSHAINEEAAKGSMGDLLEDTHNSVDAEVSKEKKKKKKSDEMTSRDNEEWTIGTKNTKETKALQEKLQSIGLHVINGEVEKVSVGDLSENSINSLHINVAKQEKKKKSDKMTLRDNDKQTGGKNNKKEKKVNEEKFRAIESQVREATEGSIEDLYGDTDSKHKEFRKGEAVDPEKYSTVSNVYRNTGTPGKEDGGKENKGNLTGNSKKDERQKSDVATTAKAFQRVKAEEVMFVDPRLQDNSYWAKDGAENGYGAKAQEILGQVRGKGFRHEKTKKKRGSYTGGMIDLHSHSIKFNYSDDE